MDIEFLYQWEHETGLILGVKHELRELEDTIKQMNDYIDLNIINDPFEWNLVSFNLSDLSSGYVIVK